MKTIIFDTEVYKNVFLLCGLVLEDNEYFAIWGGDNVAEENIRSLFDSSNCFISFNGIKYDMPIIGYYLTGKTTEELKDLGDEIIEGNLMPWEAERKYGFRIPKIDHIDLIEVAPSFVSLKTYGARMNMPTVQDLPYHHTAIITDEQKPKLQEYCFNDVKTTAELYRRLEGQIKLRVEISKEYQVDCRSKSDSQVAEQMFLKRLDIKRKQIGIPAYVRYKMPSFIKFYSDELIQLAERIEEHLFIVKKPSGHVELPAFLKDDLVRVGDGIYQMGVGGLHSQHDKKDCYVSDDNWCIMDYDVASYYPAIMLNCNLVPMNTGEKFLEEYRTLFNRRLEAKREKNMVIADSLRIALNGTFGKTANCYSPLYSPDVMINITLTGQLLLLNVIEQLTRHNIEVISANTDGIMLYYRRIDQHVVNAVINHTSEVTKFIFEATPYRCVALKDVNNYFAVKVDRSVKVKGIYSAPTLSKNPTAPIVSRAVGEWLANGTPFNETLRKGNIEDFITVRKVTGGGVQGDKYLGKVVRWYQTKEQLPPITYASNGNKVAKSSGARECMKLPVDIPEDLDYDWYENEILKVIKDIGASRFL